MAFSLFVKYDGRDRSSRVGVNERITTSRCRPTIRSAYERSVVDWRRLYQRGRKAANVTSLIDAERYNNNNNNNNKALFQARIIRKIFVQWIGYAIKCSVAGATSPGKIRNSDRR